MKRDPSAPVLSAIFVDYDNIYLSLRRKNEDAAKRFSKDAATWLRALEKGTLISSTGGMIAETPRRVVLNRCYGNPVPRRNPNDNSTDMNSFPFVRHHFLRSGFEIVDCPPLTSQQKNAADIRMVMDLRDYLTHDTYFDEFVILSGDADFTPVLHRLRQHARRTVIYSNDHTAAAYAAICDGEVREADLIAALMGEQVAGDAPVTHAALSAPSQGQARPAAHHRIEDLRQMIMAEVVAGVRAASGPVPLEALADRAIRTLGHERTVGTAWAGAGSFRELMRIGLPSDLSLSENPPFYAFDPKRHALAPVAPQPAPQATPAVAQQREALAAAMLELTQAPPQRLEAVDAPPAPVMPAPQAPFEQRMAPPPRQTSPSRQPQPGVLPPQTAQPTAPLSARAPSAEPPMHRSTATRMPSPSAHAAPARLDPAVAMQKTITRIHEACQAPPLDPREYRLVFEAAAQEISENGLAGAQTLNAILERAQAQGVSIRRDDVRFVLDVVSEPDPWFEQGATVNLFAGRFRNFVVARCRDQGMQMSADELDLVDAWFTGAPLPEMGASRAQQVQAPRAPIEAPPQVQAAAPPQRTPAPQAAVAPQQQSAGGRWWSLDEGRQVQAAQAPADSEDDFPRIVRTRRG